MVIHGSTYYFYSGVRLATCVSAAVENTYVVGVSGETVFKLSYANFQWESFPGTLKQDPLSCKLDHPVTAVKSKKHKFPASVSVPVLLAFCSALLEEVVHILTSRTLVLKNADFVKAKTFHECSHRYQSVKHFW